MLPPSNNEIMAVSDSKYAVVVAAARRARVLSEQHKKDEDYRLSSMVTRALDEIISGKLKIAYHRQDKQR